MIPLLEKSLILSDVTTLRGRETHKYVLMREELLQYIWKNVLYDSQNLMTSDGMPVQIIKHGDRNTDAGPDFFNAKIKIGETLWAGNVEIHRRSSDWKRHLHNQNHLYDSVILHVVYEHDMEITRTNGTVIPTLELSCDQNLMKIYDELLSRKTQIVVCKNQLTAIDPFHIGMWLERMLIERLEQKTEKVGTVLSSTADNWEVSFNRLLVRSFGFNVNAQAFELLSASLPMSVMAKHKDSVFQLEAMLFGQAGMLDDDCVDEYFLFLKKEYQFLKAKYSLSTMPASLWKYMRMRPANFPTIRIAQLAQLIYHSNSLLSKVIECKNVDSIKGLFDVEVSVYWLTHFSFGKASNFSTKHLGETAVRSILINAVIPVLFLYGKHNSNETISNKALQFLEQLPFENNEITRNWTETGIECNNAARSQALIHLYKNYCVEGKCLQCAIGDGLMRNMIRSI